MNTVKGLEWQVRVWDSMMPVYVEEVDRRFIPVLDHLMVRAKLQRGHRLLDVGTGTGAVVLRAAPLTAPGEVVGVDISPLMLEVSEQRAMKANLGNTRFIEGQVEDLPVEDDSFDRVTASLSLMYSLDRAQAAKSMARVLKPGGTLVAAFWSGPETNDIVKFQMMAGKFAPKPPVAGVGPGAMANGQEFVDHLEAAGLKATRETEMPGFCFDTFEDAWEVLVGVTTVNMEPARKQEAMETVREAMWPADGGPRYFNNETHYVVAEKP